MRTATLLVFKPDTTPEAAAAAVKQLEAVLDPTYFVSLSPRQRRRDSSLPVVADDGVHVLANIESYSEAHGGPTFYIP